MSSYTRTRRSRREAPVRRLRPALGMEPSPRVSGGVGRVAALMVVIGAALWLLTFLMPALSDMAQGAGLIDTASWLFENETAVKGFMLVGYPAIAALVIGVAYLAKRR